MKLNDVSDKLEKHINETNNLNDTEGDLRVAEINFVDGETNVVVNAKIFLDINKNKEDIKRKLKYSQQEVKNKLLEKKKKEIILDAAKIVEEQQTILRNHFERNLTSELEKCKKEAVKDVIQLL